MKAMLYAITATAVMVYPSICKPALIFIDPVWQFDFDITRALPPLRTAASAVDPAAARIQFKELAETQSTTILFNSANINTDFSRRFRLDGPEGTFAEVTLDGIALGTLQANSTLFVSAFDALFQTSGAFVDQGGPNISFFEERQGAIGLVPGFKMVNQTPSDSGFLACGPDTSYKVQGSFKISTFGGIGNFFGESGQAISDFLTGSNRLEVGVSAGDCAKISEPSSRLALLGAGMAGMIYFFWRPERRRRPVQSLNT